MPGVSDAAAYRYLFGGLLLTSVFPIPGLRPATGPDPAPERAIRLALGEGPAPTAERHHFAWPGRYRLKLGQHGDDWLMESTFDGAFLVSPDGRDIRVFRQTPPASGPPFPRELADVLVRRILPRLTTLFGATALHAASLALGEGAKRGGLLLLGKSGVGKSTLTAALAHLAGWDILSDDISVVWSGEPGQPAPPPEIAPQIAPAATGVSVWPPSRQGLGLDPAACTDMPGYGGKVSYQPGGPQTLESAPLKGFVFLARSQDHAAPSLQPLSHAEAMALAIPQLIKFNPDAPFPQERAWLIKQLDGVMRGVSSWRLTYPESYEALPAVAALLGALPAA